MKRCKSHPRSARLMVSASLLTAIGFALAGCTGSGSLTVGHTGGPIPAVLYAAIDDSEPNASRIDGAKFATSSDVAYGLLSDDLDAGFVSPASLGELAELPDFEELTVIGRINFPYGATIVVREGLDLRLRDLTGRRVAVAEPECELLRAVLHDAERLGLDLSGVEYTEMPFDAMIPALEAGRIDAAVLKGSHAAVAQREGHVILYQNWEIDESAAIAAGDTCCDLTLEQLELVLLARRDGAFADKIAGALDAAQAQGPDALREAAARETGIPLEILKGLPVATFVPADDSLVAEVTGYLDHEGD